MRITGFLIATAILLASCASGPQLPTSVEDRAVDRWTALINTDYERAYLYFSPAYRSTFDFESYRGTHATRTVVWTRVEPMDSRCEGARCEVKVKLHFKLAAGPPGLAGVESYQPILETWIQVDGKWFYVPNPEGKWGLF